MSLQFVLKFGDVWLIAFDFIRFPFFKTVFLKKPVYHSRRFLVINRGLVALMISLKRLERNVRRNAKR